MKPSTLAGLYRKGQLSLMFGLLNTVSQFYRLTFTASASRSGLLEALAGDPLPFERLAERFCRDAAAREGLEAWLQMGVSLKELELVEGGYTLAGYSKKLILPHNDALRAIVDEVVTLHHPMILETPGKLEQGQKWEIGDYDGELIARSSRILEPFQKEAIAAAFPTSGLVRLLEVGCGSGVYIAYAAGRNPGLSAVGIELQPQVAAMARRNLAGWGLSERVQVEAGDVRQKSPSETFDIVTLYNNIYYFPVEERLDLLKHLRGFVKPGGFLLLTTYCRGGSPGGEALNLWGATTSGCGRLPGADELVSLLQEAGFNRVQAASLLPGDKFYAFKAGN
ncbi:MAG: class I SAM-dependent methyltransferase [Chloroflexota bacterium]